MGMTDISIIMPESKELLRTWEPMPENEFERCSVNMIEDEKDATQDDG
jgi:hypothetical protein